MYLLTSTSAHLLLLFSVRNGKLKLFVLVIFSYNVQNFCNEVIATLNNENSKLKIQVCNVLYRFLIDNAHNSIELDYMVNESSMSNTLTLS